MMRPVSIEITATKPFSEVNPLFCHAPTNESPTYVISLTVNIIVTKSWLKLTQFFCGQMHGMFSNILYYFVEIVRDFLIIIFCLVEG